MRRLRRCCYDLLVAVKENTRWPREIIEVPAKEPDPRSEDAQRTQRIDKSELEAVLRRTESGFRRAVRASDPEAEKTTQPPPPLSSPAPTSFETDPLEAPPPEMPYLSPVPAPVITVKPDTTPAPLSKELAEEAPPLVLRAAPAPSRWVLALVVAALTFAALAIGYALGRGAVH
jgi:hypothetical protein